MSMKCPSALRRWKEKEPGFQKQPGNSIDWVLPVAELIPSSLAAEASRPPQRHLMLTLSAGWEGLLPARLRGSDEIPGHKSQQDLSQTPCLTVIPEATVTSIGFSKYLAYLAGC